MALKSGKMKKAKRKNEEKKTPAPFLPNPLAWFSGSTKMASMQLRRQSGRQVRYLKACWR